ncbi:MAG: hypothetical protein ACE5EO_06815 [Candidatus Krumholzibacteriia bacterium]
MLIALFSIAVLTLGAASVLAQHSEGEQHSHDKMKGMHEGSTVTMEGEVLDLYCFMKHPDKGQGAGHAKCAKNCIRKGMPIGFLSDGVVYLILGQNHEPATELVVDFAGTQAKLTGTIVEHDGVKSIEVEKIEKL